MTKTGTVRSHLGIIVTDKDDIYGMSGGYTGSDTFYGRPCTQFLYLYEDTALSCRFFISNASMYLRYLRIIDKKSEQVEEKLHLFTTKSGIDRVA